MKTIALIAHDKKKSEMLEFVGHHKELLSKFHLIATRTTGTLINDTFDLHVETMLSGPMGGDQQIGARVAVGDVDYVVFLRDPLTSQPHEPDINALLRLCDVHDVPLATNRKSAHILLSYAAGKLSADEAADAK
ncbi:methylglyoxal synthase [Mitsuokella sp. AF21-1AC]|uniref:methylglyoxal synthase n=1 Tax=Mitsuokella sp. AF21-1AC TaxID=2292235 RepID=UPI000E46F5D2|nr:methylglyoxal synthase [Mitsuokella sp. AF21-1AC]RGS72668.1 methylglyoxal synthase [Mitsuokella sp. AF21-1AC]